MTPTVASLQVRDRLALAEWIGERPETVLAVDALLSGRGRGRTHGEPASPNAAMVESPLVPDRWVVATAAAAGLVYAAIDEGSIVGGGSSMAAGPTFADVGVHVAGHYRRRGIATAAASLACHAVQDAGLRPVWGTASGGHERLI